MRTNYTPLIVKAFTVFAISQVTFIAYWYVANYTVVPEKYLANLFLKCGSKIPKTFHDAAFPYIGKTALGLFAYLGVLLQHRHFTSSTSNETELWKSLCRLVLSLGVIWIFVKQLELVTWDQNVVALYFNKTFVPCGGAAFVLCSVMDSVFEFLYLQSRDEYGKSYCVFIREEEYPEPESDSDSSNRESLLERDKKRIKV